MGGVHGTFVAIGQAAEVLGSPHVKGMKSEKKTREWKKKQFREWVKMQ